MRKSIVDQGDPVPNDLLSVQLISFGNQIGAFKTIQHPLLVHGQEADFQFSETSILWETEISQASSELVFLESQLITGFRKVPELIGPIESSIRTFSNRFPFIPDTYESLLEEMAQGSLSNIVNLENALSAELVAS
ncbi:MAG TPA: hypothetical protein EYQ50_04055 [Verrucomicrobiales bacterium]|nr:hypothetical protein [Verrucomicrobiales bacterium]HIL70338.1 hypothetical protein [Verrucomicrobiota bacterium]